VVVDNMDAMGNALLKGYEKYYNTLTQVGYVNNKTVSQLFIATWIYNVLSGKYGILVDEDRYNVLNELYNCIEGSCLVPYQNYCKEFTINKDMRSDYVRITENSINRLLEDTSDLRML
jgi:hypothetical protein